MTTTYSRNRGLLGDLAARLTAGQTVIPEDATYEQVRQLWNGRVKTRPAAIVRCLSVQDVIDTVRWTRTHGLPISVRGAGHDFAGRALSENGIAIDLSQMRAVNIDPGGRTAHVQAGATAGDLIEAAERYGLATTTGSISSVGMAGFTLGGGYSPLLGAYGLGADNLLSAQVVTADGQLLTASVREHADLLWGLRGGGGNFGVVVSLEYRLHPLTTVLSGPLLYPLDQARAVLHRFNEFIATAPDELTVITGFIQTPEGSTVLVLSPTYCGPLEDGEQAIAPLRTFGTLLVDQVQPVTYNAVIHAQDAIAPQGRHYYLQTQSLKGFQTEAIEVLIEQGLPLPSPFSKILIHNFHGAASRVGATETAFALRQDHSMVELIAAWEPQSPSEEQQHIQWAKNVSQALAPYALKGGYINALDEQEQERVPLAFGSNYERLVELKRTYDPNDVFRSTIGHITL
ncbi:FAD-binding oxidoreductase [Gloeobacter kilaueensis]|uniref:FAD linked oxidase domain-containing protein n=1 Tax=Gloeobacter kilaueensis (strain ATCC BAA-2537 / CCAP 1431/1 / ULC 316 / JS1) TaxID=1183438 RepID=U5QL95_GLOK1|nr:FAD-binding oxidoreductase [Gloeobacter kilaueensis]AGY59658.1 FAD linked oxidase domain-containing protein [Gloeobacter kilaueensis JS1]